MRTIARRALIALTLLGVLAGLGSPAYADTWTRADDRGDVGRLKFTKGNDAVIKRAPRDRTTDITRITVTHNADRVVIRLRVRDLEAADVRSIAALVKTPKRLHVVGVESFEIGYVARHMKPCPRFEKNLDYAANVITLSVPRRCLDNPKWVRVGAQMITLDSIAGRSKLYFDEALRGPTKKLKRRPALGRRIYR